MKGDSQFERWAAAGFFSAALIFGAADAAPGATRAAEFSPAAFFQALDRDAREVYAYSARVVSDLRLAYDIHARIDELRAEAAEKATAPASDKRKPLRCSASAALSR